MNALPAFASVERVIAERVVPRFEQISCPVCGAIRHEPVLRARDHANGRLEFQMVRCVGCDLHFTNPRPTADSIGQFYGADYAPHARGHRPERPLRKWYPQDWLQKPVAGPMPRLLDFGCGAGHFLSAMAKQGWVATGLDASPAMAEPHRESRILAGTLPHPSLSPRSFELITMWHVLEHVHDPVEVLNHARKLLVPGGSIVLAVPNAAGWQSRHYGADWFGLELPRHLSHFSEASLGRCAAAAGLRVEGVRFARHADWLRSSAMRAHHSRSDTPFSSLLRSKRIAQLFTWLRSRGSAGDAVLMRLG